MTEAEIVAAHNEAVASMTIPQVMAIDRLICAALLSFQVTAHGTRTTVMECLGHIIRKEAETGVHMEPNFEPTAPETGAMQ